MMATTECRVAFDIDTRLWSVGQTALAVLDMWDLDGAV